MKRVTYAGESVLTSDDVASTLVKLTAALARVGQAEAVEIPICDDSGSAHRTAQLVVGQGNDVLAVPEDGECDDSDFAPGLASLKALLAAVERRSGSSASAVPVASALDVIDAFDLDLADLERPARPLSPGSED